MDQFDTYSKASSFSSFTPVNERSSATTYGEGYVYTGPLTAQQYEAQTRSTLEMSKSIGQQGGDGQNLASTSSSSSINNISLSSSPSIEIVNTTNNNTNQYQFKVMLLGDSGVGKTCLLVRFKDGTFLAGSFIATVGIDFRNKLVTLGDKKIKLQIFDTAGQERFRSVTHSYYRDANALLLLYDVTSYSSFENISAWLSEIKEFAHDGVVIMLIGNKIDKSQRVVSREAGERLARDYEVSFLETSAKTGQNVELAFMATAQALLDKELSRKTPQSGHSTLNDIVRMSGMSLNNTRDNYNNMANNAKTNGWCC
ncbi:unnamed protein product [Adineta steineri]|uniref:Uncharacterized protein n=1 Tax=Adineta steineri TaxID=433720 RepID=A0A818RQX0_9BILA|nr:unnamed protein product [Adineta steineri]CAF0934847.1 unnamed protein product [Adineta steineri]CAF0950206.1 unnamed protein product [Adineta steineri]CAF3657066.1 unnamed protein product [Adineta steineri]CAF3783027.1 unnamed protein product [Adineta steineri]